MLKLSRSRKVFFLTVTAFLYFYINVAISANNADSLNTKKTQTNNNEQTSELEILLRDEMVTAGGVFTATISKPAKADFLVTLGQTRAVLIKQKNTYKIMAGVDINTLFGEYLVSIQTPKAQLERIPFFVESSKAEFIENYENRHLPATKDITKKLLWSNREPQLPLIYPATGDWQEFFGAYYQAKNSLAHQNDLKRVEYLKLDITQPIDIMAPSKGVCFRVEFDEGYGYRVLLDHGMGLFSEISGLDNLLIEEQDVVEQGTMISSFKPNNLKTAKTVYWRVFMTNALVNPQALM